ncbi:class I SAM-dependent methyltransferase [Barrientosiimonas marina]|uniref:SAM-dependent methyltransferase n=1 Tax=Lentibacillus kimchii TaxID=1542911 RepID=A0ABW2UQX1_9BACI
MKEYRYDKLLNIKTRRKKWIHADLHHNPYEPTPYHALETLCHNYHITSHDQIVDFGCGKGRLNFFSHYYYQASVTGVEMNYKLFKEAIKNRYRYMEQTKQATDPISFHCCLAEDYRIDPADNRFYFFNPFSIQVFKQVVNNILHSAAQSAREIELIMYYASNAYIRFLDGETAFERQKEIVLPEMINRDPYERFNIYRLTGTE